MLSTGGFVSAPLSAAEEEPIATILCYHEVDDAPTHATIARQNQPSNQNEQRRYTITTKQFDEQLDYLARNGYSVVPLQQLVAALAGKATLPKRAVVITVDDGWLCAYTNILPVLRNRNLPFTLFVYPDIVNNRGAHAVTWPQLKMMAAMKGVQVESHSRTHASLTRKSLVAAEYEAFVTDELAGSQKLLRTEVGQPVRYLSYPYGDYDDEVITAVKKSGYVAAVTVQRGVVTKKSDPFRLKRYLIHNDTTLEQFKTFLVP